MAETRRRFDPEFRAAAVQTVRETGKPVAQVARELGIKVGTLGDWVAKDRIERGDRNGATADPRPEPVRRRMDLAIGLRILARHWLVVGAVALATVFAALASARQVQPTYEATATLLFLPPNTADGPGGELVPVNPYSRTGTAERVAADAIVNLTSSQRWSERIERAGAAGAIEYEPTSEVIIEVTASATTADEALFTLDTGVRLVQEELVDRQRDAGAPEDTFITAEILSMSDAATQRLRSRFRVMGAVGVIGLATAASVAFALEALGRPRLRWSRWRQRGARWLRALRGPDVVRSGSPGVVPTWGSKPASESQADKASVEDEHFPRDEMPVDGTALSPVLSSTGMGNIEAVRQPAVPGGDGSD